MLPSSNVASASATPAASLDADSDARFGVVYGTCMPTPFPWERLPARRSSGRWKVALAAAVAISWFAGSSPGEARDRSPFCGGPYQRPCKYLKPACDEGVMGPMPGARLVVGKVRGKTRCVWSEPGMPSSGPVVPRPDELCGSEGQPPCPPGTRDDPGCEEGTMLGAGGRCQPCGDRGERPCLKLDEAVCNSATLRLDPRTRTCRPCGGEGDPPCTLAGACRRGFRYDGEVCRAMGPASEPDCDCTVEPGPTAPGRPISGFADLHSHPFSNLAFGGLVLWGDVFHEEGIQSALPLCDFSGGLDAVVVGNIPYPQVPWLGTPVHREGGKADAFGHKVRRDALGRKVGSHRDLPHPLGVGGGEAMRGWPTWDSVTHQQMYYRWIERAWRGGLRLLVVHAVNNEVLCKGKLPLDSVLRRAGQLRGFGCGDGAAVSRQIEAARALERFVDEEHGGRGRGWFRIVQSGAEARRVVEQGKLAVVLGIEVDSLFDCKVGRCDEDDVGRGLDEVHALGVRHLIPIHLFDNAFGGAAMYKESLVAGSAVFNGRPMQPSICRDPAYGLPARSVLFSGDLPAQAPICNALGLTGLGETMVRGMMARGMIVDIDHMSARAKTRVLEIAEEEGYPVVSGHAELTSSVVRKHRSERALTPGEVDRIRRLGGVVAVKMLPMDADTVLDHGPVADDCDLSARNWAQVYSRMVDLLGGEETAAVGFGSDFNGMIVHAAPRFGADGCNRDPDRPQRDRIEYPFAAHDRPGTFERSRTGSRVFDYNQDGLAHVGLLPDFVEDLKKSGLSDPDLAPLFRSAEAYIAMWEAIDAR